MTKKQQFKLFSLFFLILVSVLIIRNKTQQETPDSYNVEEKSTIQSCSTNQLQTISPIVPFSGRVKSINKISIISEASGLSRVENSRFEVGEKFNKGDVLLAIKNDDLRLDLKSIKSQFLTLLVQILPDLKMDFPELGISFQNYINNYSLDYNISEIPSNLSSKQTTFLASKQIFSNYYKIKSLENKLEKFTIRAPFDGFLTKTLIDPGSNIIMGQPLGEFISTKDYELVTSVSILESRLINEGDGVDIFLDNYTKNVSGKIKRIGQNINELTQSIDVYIDILEGDVIDGMYVSGNIHCKEIANKVMIARSKIINNQLFILEENKTVKLKDINIIAFQNDSVIIDGLNENDCVLDEYRSYYYDGMIIN